MFTYWLGGLLLASAIYNAFTEYKVRGNWIRGFIEGAILGPVGLLWRMHRRSNRRLASHDLSVPRRKDVV